MKNRSVGLLIVGMAALMGLITWLFNRALTQIVNDSCSHGPTCPMWGSISFHTNISIVILLFILILGVYLIFFAKDDTQIIKEVRVVKEQVKPKKLDKEHYTKMLDSMSDEERAVMEKILDSNGTIFQSELVDRTEFTKVKVTRILDRLEGKDIIERRRRGMTNVIILKHGKG